MRSLLATLAALSLAFGAQALAVEGEEAPDSPLTPRVQNGVLFVSGGVGDREQRRLRELEGDYNVRVALTNAEGAYLQRVDFAIEDDSGRSLVEATTRGPIVLVRLEPGRYLLRAATEGRSAERRVIDVPEGGDPVRLYVALVDTGA